MMKILYVEDSPHDADLTRRTLTKSAPHIQLDIAVTLEAARRRLLETTDYDLVLLDLRLPDGSGLELLSEIRLQKLSVVVVVMTGSGDEFTAVAALKAGADDYLVKKADYLERLPDVLEKALARFQDGAAQRIYTLRVAYVERHSADIDLTRRHLSRYAPHIQLEIMGSIEEALRRLPETPDQPCPYDVLLLDYQLPGLNALEALKIIRDERRLDLPIILVTGQGDEEIATQALRLGASDYLVKHARYLFELPAALENAYHRAQMTREHVALVESEARFRRLAENASDIIFRVGIGPEAAIDYISPAVATLTGYTAKEFYTVPGIARQIIHEEDLSRLMTLAAGQTESASFITIRLTHKDGRLVWMEINPVFVKDENGNITALEGIARDITANKEAEETLALQSAALNAAANAIIITDHESNIQWANPAFATLTGFTIEEALGSNLKYILKSDFHDEAFYDNLQNTIMAGEVWRGEIVNRRKDGSLYTEGTTITPLVDAGGRTSHFIEIKQDISARKEAEADRDRLLAQVREQAQRVQQIIETVPEGVLLLDGDGRVILANPVAERDLAFLAQTDEADVVIALGKRPLSGLLLPPPPGNWHEIEHDGRTFEALARLVSDDNAGRENGADDHWVMVLNDVTDARAQSRYQQAQERLAMVGQLAAGIAHDFNNVLSVISLYSELLQKSDTLPAKGQQQLQTIYNQTRHGSKLIEQILDFSRRSVMEMTTMDLLPLVKEMIKLLGRTMPENIKLSLDYDQKEYVVKADPTRLQQALMNLAVNARDAMPEGGQLRIKLAALDLAPDQPPPLPDMAAGRWVELVVTDTGAGIAAEHLARLFEPFFTTKAPGKGTGLGLAQVHGIVKQHGGSIDVQSEIGRGSTFSLFLPLLSVADPKAQPNIERVAAQIGGTETILLVEDNAAMLASTADSLKLLGYRVLTAASGEAALALLAQEETAVSLMLTDLIMPAMGGVALSQIIHEQYPLTKFLIMTGHPFGQDAEALQELEVVNFLQKPFTVELLAARVRAALDKTA